MNDMKNNHAGCYRTLQMIGVLHSRGYQRLRIFPYGRGMWWRCEVAPGALFDPENGACLQSHPAHDREGLIARFGSGECDHPFGWKNSIAKLSAAKMADLFIQRFPRHCPGYFGLRLGICRLVSGNADANITERLAHRLFQG